MSAAVANAGAAGGGGGGAGGGGASGAPTHSRSASLGRASVSGKEVPDEGETSVKSTDMNDAMQEHVLQLATKAIEQASQGPKNDFHSTIARIIKKEFDATYGGVWHCIAGRNFGSWVVHESRTFIYFYHGQTAIMLFKSGCNA